MPDPTPNLSALNDAELIEHILEVEADEVAAKLAKKKLHNELLNRKAAELKIGYDAKPEPFGVVNLSIADKNVKVDFPKKVEWLQTELEALWNQIVADGANPKQYIKVEYTVSETLYKTFGDNMKAYFTNARIVKGGNPSIKISDKEE